ncbi:MULTISPECIES: hypothetical protein [unclassified Polaribacter]|uniref:hypothetical protein n=1 Tax=unclassified Polaribacter TaxID=196858 RepID=UPI0011BE699D|nr:MULTISPECIES: hypothetical protein [unclassified Polaribacter]TXD52793.1 hypothetical protein ES043_07095 [Polaribacter sp. IC063]TXD61670.1 hypothetical protein ES044_04055 [Polaribacter sp. IC066]
MKKHLLFYVYREKEIKPKKNRKDVLSLFPRTPATSKIFDIVIEYTQTYYGRSFGLYKFKNKRNDLKVWAKHKE